MKRKFVSSVDELSLIKHSFPCPTVHYVFTMTLSISLLSLKPPSVLSIPPKIFQNFICENNSCPSNQTFKR